jgi:hypothetical protein
MVRNRSYPTTSRPKNDWRLANMAPRRRPYEIFNCDDDRRAELELDDFFSVGLSNSVVVV